MNFRCMSDDEFVRYLNGLADDFDQSRLNATADDYREAALRIEKRKLVFNSVVNYIQGVSYE